MPWYDSGVAIGVIAAGALTALTLGAFGAEAGLAYLAEQGAEALATEVVL